MNALFIILYGSVSVTVCLPEQVVDLFSPFFSLSLLFVFINIISEFHSVHFCLCFMNIFVIKSPFLHCLMPADLFIVSNAPQHLFPLYGAAARHHFRYRYIYTRTIINKITKLLAPNIELAYIYKTRWSWWGKTLLTYCLPVFNRLSHSVSLCLCVYAVARSGCVRGGGV